MKHFLVKGYVFHPVVGREIDITVAVEDLKNGEGTLQTAYQLITHLPETQKCDVTIESVEEIVWEDK